MSQSDLPSTQNEKSLRVLFVGVAYIIGVYQAKLHAFAKTRRVEVALLCPAGWKFREWSRKFVLKTHYDKIRLYPANVWLFNGRAGAYLYPLHALLHALRDFKPDLIYVEQEVFSLSAFQVALFARLFKIPLAVFCWENMDRRLSLMRRWTRQFVLHTARLITPGNHRAADLLRRWGYTGLMEILPQLGVDTGLFSPHLDRRAGSPFSIGFVGRLVPEKGVDLILTAAKRLLDQGLVCRVVICGVGPYESALRIQTEKLGLSGYVEWLGEFKYEDVPQAIAQMDVLVLPSRTIAGRWQEQFGHVLIEAMAMGVPVVGSSSGAIPDVVGRDDLIFAEEDPDGLEAILHRIITDSQYRDDLIRYGLDRISTKFTNTTLAGELTVLFRELIAGEKQ